jgi:hypothetical protein
MHGAAYRRDYAVFAVMMRQFLQHDEEAGSLNTVCRRFIIPRQKRIKSRHAALIDCKDKM